jgi:hypothetical protein
MRILSSLSRITTATACWIGFLAVSTTSTAQNPGFVMHMETVASVLPGSNFIARALLDNPAGDLAGWSAVVCHDANIEIVSAETGAAASIANGGALCDFISTVVFPGEGSAQFSTDPFFSNTIVIETTGISIIPTMISTTVSISTDLFIRGEINGDTSINIADAMFLLAQLFSGGPVGTCADANDVNDDGSVNLGDPVTLLAYLFSGGVTPPTPFPTCGVDPSADSLGCEIFLNCP